MRNTTERFIEVVAVLIPFVMTAATVEKTFSAGEALYSNTVAAVPANPFVSAAHGGTWTWIAAVNTTCLFRSEFGADLATGFARASGWKGLALANAAPIFVVNPNDAAAQEVSALDAVSAHGVMLQPSSSREAVLRFRPDTAGWYSVQWTVCDIHSSGGQDICDGVKYLFSLNGKTLAEGFVSKEYNCPSAAGERVFSRKIGADETFEFFVDGSGNNAYDWTELQLVFTKYSDADHPPADATGDAGLAYAAEVRAKKSVSANPFTDANSDTWAFGLTPTQRGPLGVFEAGCFALLPTWNVKRVDEIAGRVASGGLPAVQANIANATVAFTTGENGISTFLYRDELYIQPKNDNMAVCRYTAPSTGVYRATAGVRDINGSTARPTATGVACHVAANGGLLAGGTASIDGMDATLMSSFDADVRSVYLKAGEPFYFIVGPNGAYDFTDAGYCDNAAIWAKVLPDAADAILSVDFNAPGSATFVGCGRVGYSDGVWNGVAVGGTVASIAPGTLRLSEGGGKTGTTFALTRAAGNPATDEDVGFGGALADGLVSSGAEDIYTLAVSGLVPSATYTLYLYGGEKDGTGAAVFTVGGTAVSSGTAWRREGVCDFVKTAATADVQGHLVITFAAAEGTSALWRGFQIAGTAFCAYVPKGTFIAVH